MKSNGPGTAQEKVLTVRKEKSRDAARNRRSKENLQYVELAKLLSLPEAITSQLDKASVIRLTISFLKYHDLTGKGVRKHSKSPQMLNGVKIAGRQVIPYTVEKNLGLHMLQALDGFLFCVSQEGRFLYISETVSTHLGLSQLDLVGSSVFNIIHADDHKEFSELLCRPIQPNVNDFLNLDDSDAVTMSEMFCKSSQGYISIFIRMKCTLVKCGGCYVKSSGYKVIHICGQMVPFKHIDHNGDRPFALIATGQPLPPPTICELKLDTKVFVSRVGMDLKIAFCEGKIRKYMDYRAKDIVGMSAYEFYHLNDMIVVQDAHTDCLQSGKCVSRLYRWMNKVGGWIWMQTVGSVIKRNTSHGEESQILCVNYIFSDVEESNEVMHSIQQHFRALDINNGHKYVANEFEDHEIESKTSVPNASKPAYTPPADTGNDVMDKDSYLLALQYNDIITNNLQTSGIKTSQVSGGNLDSLMDSRGGLVIPCIADNIPTWQESQAMETANELANSMLLMEMEADTSQSRYPFAYEFPSSPEEANSFNFISPPLQQCLPMQQSIATGQPATYSDNVCSLRRTTAPTFYENNINMESTPEILTNNQFSIIEQCIQEAPYGSPTYQPAIQPTIKSEPMLSPEVNYCCNLSNNNNTNINNTVVSNTNIGIHPQLEQTNQFQNNRTRLILDDNKQLNNLVNPENDVQQKIQQQFEWLWQNSNNTKEDSDNSNNTLLMQQQPKMLNMQSSFI